MNHCDGESIWRISGECEQGKMPLWMLWELQNFLTSSYHQRFVSSAPITGQLYLYAKSIDVLHYLYILSIGISLFVSVSFCISPVVDSEGVPWVPWNPPFVRVPYS